MSWMWVISLIVAVAVGLNLGVVLMALIQGGMREDQRRDLPGGGHP